MLARKLGAYTLLAFLVLPASLQAQTTGIMQITVDTVLTQDHIGIIQVKADGIHLDCDGHSIISEVPSQYAGVALDTQDGITVTNCHASGFVRGFMAQIAEDIELANNSATNNFNGFNVYRSRRVHVINNQAYKNAYGVSVGLSSDSLVQDNVIEDSVERGIYLPSTYSSRVLDNVLNSNRAGIGLGGSDDNVIAGNTISGSDNAIDVIFFPDIDISLIKGNTIIDNTIIGSAGVGIRVAGGIKNMVSGNSLLSNLNGINLSTSSSENMVVDNTITLSRNSAIGIFEDALNNDVYENTLELNCKGAQVRNGAQANRVYNNNFINNGTQAEVLATAGPNNDFSSGTPVSGNYWNDFDELSEGCSDNSPGDGFCDASYLFIGGLDAYSLKERDGWLGGGGGQVDDSNTVDPCTSTDFDMDGVDDAEDNCPFDPNPTQADSDEDGLGEKCDPDDDNDGVDDLADNCPLHYNPGQEDSDGNGVGNACTFDADEDGVLNELDQCPDTPLRRIVNEDGCSGGQLIELTCRTSEFRNHGQFVSCVAHTANEAARLGLITPQEKARFVTQAAHTKW